MLFYLCASSGERPKTDPRLLAACVDYCFERPFPAELPSCPDGVMLLGGDLCADRTGEICEECRKRGFKAVLAGFGTASGVEVFRFCDGLLRRGLTPILTENAWRTGCGAELLISAAVSGGELRSRLSEAKTHCSDLCLDMERLRHSFPIPCPDGEGTPVGESSLQAMLRQGAEVHFSEELVCKAFTAEEHGKASFILFDDRETLVRKAKLAAEMGVGRCFLLYPEWSVKEAASVLLA